MLICLSLIAFFLFLVALALFFLAFEVRMLRCGHVAPTLVKEIAKSIPEPVGGWRNEAAFTGRTDY